MYMPTDLAKVSCMYKLHLQQHTTKHKKKYLAVRGCVRLCKVLRGCVRLWLVAQATTCGCVGLRAVVRGCVWFCVYVCSCVCMV